MKRSDCGFRLVALVLVLVAGGLWGASRFLERAQHHAPSSHEQTLSEPQVVALSPDRLKIHKPLGRAPDSSAISAAGAFKPRPAWGVRSREEVEAAIVRTTPELVAGLHEYRFPEVPPPPMRKQPYGSGGSYLDPPTQALFEETLEALGEHAEWRIHTADGTLKYLRGPLANVLAGDHVFERARSEGNTVLVARRALHALAPLMNITDPDAEFAIVSSDTCSLGMTHVRFQQQLGGYAIFGAETIVHLDEHHDPYQLNGVYAPATIPVDSPVHIGPEAALKAARTAVDAGDYDLVEPVVRKAYYWRPGVQPRLAWQVDISPSIHASWHVFVSVADGSLIHVLSAMPTAAGVVTVPDLTGVDREFHYWEVGVDNYYACDTSNTNMYDPASEPPDLEKTKGVIGVGTVGNEDFAQAFNEGRAQWVMSESTDVWSPGGVSLQHNLRMTEQYFRDTHGRNSMDNDGMNILGFINARFPFGGELCGDNACWHPGVNMMFFGDGINTYTNLPSSLSLVAHEYTHGVVTFTANLKYENQSGALNELFADFFGVMVEREGWVVASTILQDPSVAGLRDMSDPANPHVRERNPKHMSEYQNLPNTPEGDYGGVHINVGIPSYAAYLMTDALDDPIGWERAEQIHYRALTVYLTQYAQFNDYRAALISAARDLYAGEPTVEANIMNALASVGIGPYAPAPGGDPEPEPDPAPPPPPGPVPDGGEQTVFNAVYDMFGNMALYLHDVDSEQTGLVAPRYVADTRPAVSGNGELGLYVCAAHDLWVTDGEAEEQLTAGGLVRTVAMSKDARYVAYTITTLTNMIVMVDLVAETQTVHQIEIPVPDGPNMPISYADVMSFSFGGDYLVFDGLYEGIIGGETVSFWGVYALRIADGAVYQLTSFVQGLNVGNPSMAHTFEQYAVCDYIYQEGGASVHGVILLDFINNSHDVLFSGTPTLSQPSFRGDDNKLVFRWYDTVNTCYWMSEVELAEDKKSIVPDSDDYLFWWSHISYPVGFRAGEYTPPAGLLTVSKSELEWPGTVEGRTSTETIIVTNAGNATVEILHIHIEGDDVDVFSHNGINQRLVAEQALAVQVRFAPTVTGQFTATMRIKTSQGNEPDILVTLDGRSISALEDWLVGHGYTLDQADAYPEGKFVTLRDHYIANLNPTDTNDYFTVEAATNEAGGHMLSFLGREERFYRVYSRTNLLLGDWAVLGIYSNLLGEGSVIPVEDPDSSAQQRFYRIGVRLVE